VIEGERERGREGERERGREGERERGREEKENSVPFLLVTVDKLIWNQKGNMPISSFQFDYGQLPNSS
jgi:hypothetical protein